MNTERVLVAEDEAITGLYLSRVLTESGFDVIDIVSTAEEVVLRAVRDRPDLILMDILLKGTMSGTDAAMEIHSRYGIPILYVSAFTSEGLLQRNEVDGAFDYIPKPIDVETLLKKLRRLLDRNKVLRLRRTTSALNDI